MLCGRVSILQLVQAGLQLVQAGPLLVQAGTSFSYGGGASINPDSRARLHLPNTREAGTRVVMTDRRTTPGIAAQVLRPDSALNAAILGSAQESNAPIFAGIRYRQVPSATNRIGFVAG